MPGYTLAGGDELATLAREIPTRDGTGKRDYGHAEGEPAGQGDRGPERRLARLRRPMPSATAPWPAVIIWTAGNKRHAVPRAGCREAWTRV